MALPLNVLILEDHYDDALLMVNELARAGYQVDWHLVDNQLDYQAQLNEAVQIILADYSLPQFDAHRALELLNHCQLDIPFIVVSGKISEEEAVTMMKLGAADYLLKDRLARLGQAVKAALAQKQARDKQRSAQQALAESEARLRRMTETASELVYQLRLRPTQGFEYVSPAATRLTGYTPEEHYSDAELIYKLVHPDDRPLLELAMQSEGGLASPLQTRWIRKDGRQIWVEQHITPIYDPEGQLVALEGIVRDVTEQVQRQRELEALVMVGGLARTVTNRAELAKEVLNLVTSLLEADGAALVQRDPASGDSVVELACGELAASSGKRIPPGKGITGRVIASGQFYITQNVRADHLVYWPTLMKNMQAAACAPLVSQDKPFGALLIARRRHIDLAAVGLLTAIADILASALHRALLNEQTQRYAEQMAVVGRIGRILAETISLPETLAHLNLAVHDMLPDISSVFVALYDEQRQELSCAFASVDGKPIDTTELPPVPLEPPGQGTQSEAIHTRKAFFINNLRERAKKVSVLVEVSGDADTALHAQSGLYAPMLVHGKVIGVLQAQSYTPNRFTQPDAEALSLAANTAAVAIENSRLISDLQNSNCQLLQAYDNTLEGWAHALDLRDKETEGHTMRVVKATEQLARALGIDEGELTNLRRGALLHDIGKLGIPDRILLKHGPLSSEEWAVMQRHPQYAYDWLSPIDYLGGALDIPYCHHERWDGTGYPRHLRGEQIPLAARIFAVVDVWDALRSDRPYRPAWSETDARQYLSEESGKHFDPHIVDVFLREIDKKSLV